MAAFCLGSGQFVAFFNTFSRISVGFGSFLLVSKVIEEGMPPFRHSFLVFSYHLGPNGPELAVHGTCKLFVAYSLSAGDFRLEGRVGEPSQNRAPADAELLADLLHCDAVGVQLYGFQAFLISALEVHWLSTVSVVYPS